MFIESVLPVSLHPGSRLARTVSISKDDFALHGDVMQPGAFKFSMVLLAVLTHGVVVGIGHFLVSVQHTAIEIIVHTAFPQNGQEFFKLQLQTIGVLLGHYVVIEKIAFGEDIGGDEETSGFISLHADGLHNRAIEDALWLPVGETEFARTHDDELAASLLVFYYELSRVVDLAIEGSVQLGTALLLEVPEDWYARIQLVVLLGEVLLLQLLGKVLDDLPMLTVLKFVFYLYLVRQVALYLKRKLLRNGVLSKHPPQYPQLPFQLLAAFAHG